MSEAKQRKYLPTLSDLLDRMSIVTLKEWFITERKKEYAQEIDDIINDIDIILEEEKVKIDGEMLHALIVLAATNLSIWRNEASFRKNGNRDGADLELSHSLNSIRNFSKNIIQAGVGHGRKDYKLDCICSEAENYRPVRWENKEKTELESPFEKTK